MTRAPTIVTADVRVGQIWRENDKRFTRFVKVIAVDEEVVTIASLDHLSGSVSARLTRAKLKRFGKSYALHKDAA